MDAVLVKDWDAGQGYSYWPRKKDVGTVPDLELRPTIGQQSLKLEFTEELGLTVTQELRVL